MSRTSSSPTDTRMVPSVMPTAARAAGSSRRCVVVAGCVVRDFGVAEVVGDVDELQGVEEREGSGTVTDDVERHDGTSPTLELTQGERVLGVAGEVREEHPQHTPALGPPALQRGRHLQRRLGHPAHPEVEGLQALGQDPRVEGGHRRAGVPHEVLDGTLDELLRTEDRATEGAALAVDVLRGRVDDDVGTVRQGVREDRCAEDVVHDDLGTRGVGEVAHGRRCRRAPASGCWGSRRRRQRWEPPAPLATARGRRRRRTPSRRPIGAGSRRGSRSTTRTGPATRRRGPPPAPGPPGP